MIAMPVTIPARCPVEWHLANCAPDDVNTQVFDENRNAFFQFLTTMFAHIFSVLN